MNLSFDLTVANNYTSNSQKIRRLTEDWFENNMFCPRCGNDKVAGFENNRPVADFYCENCDSQYELKSKNGKLANKIIDGAYQTMIERINSNENPDLFCLSYSKDEYKVNNLLFIPKHFFVPEIIERRKPLSDKARRAGWVGCNILIDKVPSQGKIHIINNGIVLNKTNIVEQSKKNQLLMTKNLSSRGWMLDILMYINRIKGVEFSLQDIYKFENELSLKYIDNKNIQAKIRQQLQFLRDKGFIMFLGNGKYRKVT